MLLKTKRLIIRKFKESDLDELYKLLSDEDVMKYIEPPFTYDETREFMKKVALIEKPLIYALECFDGNFIGYAIYHEFDSTSYEVGFIIYKKYWGLGYASEVTEFLCHDAFNKGKSLVIECDEKQEATKNIAIKNGFKYIGKEDNCCIYKRIK